MKLTFLGAAETVTGSKYLLETKNKKFLIDCGLFQGLKELRLKNWEPPEFNPEEVDAVLLTHGHLDHTGYLPRLVKLGFQGPIYGTAPTLKIAEIILEDTAKIQMEEADKANRLGYSKHKPALPLYDLDDVAQTLKYFRLIEEEKPFHLGNQIEATWRHVGHILGATFIELKTENQLIVFSGDIGRTRDLILAPPKKPEKADILLIESTYGGSLHPEEDKILPQMSKIITKTIKRGGSVFIPSFAVERNQLIMLILHRLAKKGKIPAVPMIMDSPMGANILDLFEQTQPWHKLKPNEYRAMCRDFIMVSEYSETLKLRKEKSPKIVIAGSGMLTGGRILSYLETHAKNQNDTLLFVGYQAEGTRGRKLLDGETSIKMYGKQIPFRMHVEKIDGLSAHADQKELLDWLSNIKTAPSKIFIIHGEKEQAKLFKEYLYKHKQWQATIPTYKDVITTAVV